MRNYSEFQSFKRLQYQKLKHTEIMYIKGSEIQDLVSLLLCAPNNAVTLTEFEEAE
jgi:hypothetical protein